MARSCPYLMKKRLPTSDAKILRESQTQPWMFGVLVDRHQVAFLRKASYILHSKELAEDAVQDTFLKIYKYGPKFLERKNASFRSWAYKILLNTCYSYASKKVRDNGRVRTMEFADLDVSGNTSEIYNEDRVSLVQSVLTRLPGNLSRLLKLYFFEDKSYEEIAILEKLSLSAVRSGLHRARQQFKNIALKMV